MKDNPESRGRTRLGFHYYPDTSHYRDADLRTWVPELRTLGTSWLTLLAPKERAIPEAFLEGLRQANIEPVLHFNFSPSNAPHPEELAPLIEAYARWGIRYIALFDRPNRRRSWSVKDWVQNELVERFVDLFIPLVEPVTQAGLTPIFPPLQPGGDYWDTAFLRTALEAIKRRGHHDLLKALVLGAQARADNRPLNWGAGGPERWPGARPYYTPEGEEDQIGFRIFDWYIPISKAVLGYALPIMLFGAGSQPGDQGKKDLPVVDETTHTERNLALMRLSLGDRTLSDDEVPIDELPPNVLAVNFWLLAAQEGSRFISQAWFKPDGKSLPVVGAVRQWLPEYWNNGAGNGTLKSFSRNAGDRLIAHYLLLPSYEWGVADWHLDVIRPYMKLHRPTVGFSLVEASQATRVTVIGGPQSFSEEVLEELRAAGCIVERVEGDGTSIASTLNDGP